MFSTLIVTICFVAACVVAQKRECEAKLKISQDAIRTALENHPHQTEPFVCQLAMSLDDPNNEQPSYSTCVNKLLYQNVKIEPMSMRNQMNWTKMVAAVKDKKLANQLYQCSLMLEDCIDVENVFHCLKYNVA